MLQLLDLPAEILEDIFLELPLPSLIVSRRVCRAFHTLLTTNVSLVLHFELLCASLSAPQGVRRKTAASTLLSVLRERQTRFRNFKPATEYRVKVEETSRLYEYLEGHLLLGSGDENGDNIDEDDDDNGDADERHEELLQNIARELGVGVEQIGGIVGEGIDRAQANLNEIVEFFTGRRRRRGLPHSATLYDLTTGSEWEEVADGGPLPAALGNGDGEEEVVEEEEEDEDEVLRVDREDNDDVDHYQKRKWNSDGAIKDFAMDPGQDLYVVAEMKRHNGDPKPWKLNLRIMTLSDFSQHPQAPESGRLDAVLELDRNPISLTLQICDDKIFVYVSHLSERRGPPGFRIPSASIVCWRWTTGELVSVHHSLTSEATRESGIDTLDDCLLLTDMTYAVMTYTSHSANASATPLPREHPQLSLDVYRLIEVSPSTAKDSYSNHQASHKPVLVARFLMPKFRMMLTDVGLRADPPPRKYFPRAKPLQLYPQPDTGLICMHFDADDGRELPIGQPWYYTLFVLKQTLLGFLPPEESTTTATSLEELVTIPFETLAPLCRFRTDIPRQGWAVYVYGYRHISGEACTNHSTEDNEMAHIIIDDYDPRAVRHALANPVEHEGMEILTKECTVKADMSLVETVVTGSQMPFTSVRDTVARPLRGLMIDDCRAVSLYDRVDSQGRRNHYLDVLQM